MADYNTEQLLEMIQRQGGAANVDLSGHDLTGINLSGEVLEELLEEMGYTGAGRGPAWFEPWTKGVSLSGAQLGEAQLRMADLRNACMERADLHNADMAGAFLQDATLEDADLRRANLTGAVLSHTILWAKKPTLEGVYLYGAQIEFTPCTRDQFGAGIGEELDRDWLRAREAYLTLRHNFLDLGRYTDASWAYRKERRMERAISFPSEEGDRWVRDAMTALPEQVRRLPGGLLRFLTYARLYLRPQRGVPLYRLRHLGNWLQDATCEYGENPWRLMLWAAGVVLAFAGVHLLADLLSPVPVSLAAAPGQPAGVAAYLSLSILSFASMSFQRVEPVSAVGALLASVEAMLGLGLLALFMYTLGRRMSGN
jgi:uncharacterized protein YjbI with pentapeptide repeats